MYKVNGKENKEQRHPLLTVDDNVQQEIVEHPTTRCEQYERSAVHVDRVIVLPFCAFAFLFFLWRQNRVFNDGLPSTNDV